MTVYFVGDKPSRLNTDPEVAFIGAKCYPRLLSWINDLGCEDYMLINKDKISSIPKRSHVVALGKEASSELAKKDIVHFQLPHPSGLNRKINDKKYVDDMLVRCKQFLAEEVLDFNDVILCEGELWALHSHQTFKMEDVLVLVDLDGGSTHRFKNSCRLATKIDLMLYKWAASA